MRIVQETIYFAPIGDIIEVRVCVFSPNIKDHKITAIFCDGEDFLDFVNQNGYTEQVLDNQLIDKSICLAQDEIRLESLIQFRDELIRGRQTQAA
jgi:hypothetical protein